MFFVKEDATEITNTESWNHYLYPAIRGIRWLAQLDVKDLTGDDAVGWWALIYAGKLTPPKLIDDFIKKLEVWEKRIDIDRIDVYTYSIILRTLIHSGISIKKLETSKKTLEYLIKKELKTPNIRNLLWAAHTCLEIGWTGISAFEKISRALATSNKLNLDDMCMCIPILHLHKKWAKPLEKMHKKILHAVATEEYKSMLDWNLVYLLLSLIIFKNNKESKIVADWLVKRQFEGMWDASTDENIESTSVASLALIRYCEERLQRELRINKHDTWILKSLIKYHIRETLDIVTHLHSLWRMFLSEQDNNKKGDLFAEFIISFIKMDHQFKVVDIKKRTESEEIDIVLENMSDDSFFRALSSPIIIVECKGWTGPITSAIIRDFRVKIENRSLPVCKIGLLITSSRLTDDANTELIGLRGKDFTLATADKDDINKILTQELTFPEFLKEQLRKAGLR